MLFASASLVSLISVAMIRAAPAALQIPTAKIPIGPQPVIAPPRRDVGGEHGMERVPHWIVDTDIVRSSSGCQTVVAGIGDSTRRSNRAIGAMIW
jgi:hypothetical protein